MDTHINMESNLEEQKVSASVVNPSFQLFFEGVYMQMWQMLL